MFSKDRFSKVMKERVEAMSKVEELEHINLQLQNECDTIGNIKITELYYFGYCLSIASSKFLGLLNWLQLFNIIQLSGEYITLYHNQRQVLKQRHHEKDEYVSAMAQERELLQVSLRSNQTLVDIFCFSVKARLSGESRIQEQLEFFNHFFSSCRTGCFRFRRVVLID